MAKKAKQYTGCIANIEKARDFARESFVYGLKDKSEHTEISPRAYDEATRQMGDWFQECLQTRTVKVRKKVKYLSLNCRDYAINPLYKLWKTCSFTTNEIVFFFFLLDYLADRTEAVSLSEIHEDYYRMHRTDGFLRSAAQKWLQNKGCPSGIVIKDDRSGYRLAPAFDLSDIRDLISYYSEVAPGGVIGSFILDKQEKSDSPFGFKQHYIGQAFDCEVICNILLAIRNDRNVEVGYLTKNGMEMRVNVFPLKVYSSTQNGRQYLIAWDGEGKRFYNYRIDRIRDITISEVTMPDAKDVKERYEEIKKHIWGVSLGNGELDHVEFIVKVAENESYVLNRLNREKRCGMVTPVENRPGYFRFEADVYDAHEMFPWIRTFICRIVELKISDSALETLFLKTLDDMCAIYAVEGGQS